MSSSSQPLDAPQTKTAGDAPGPAGVEVVLPELLQPAPRRVQLRPRKRDELVFLLTTLGILSGVFIACALQPSFSNSRLASGVIWSVTVLCLCMAALLVRITLAMRHLVQHGTAAYATITKREEAPGQHARYFLHYTYSTPDGVRQGVAVVTRDYYEARKEGDRILIVYDPQAKPKWMQAFIYDQADWMARL